MTREEAIARIKEHKIIHKMNEPRAIFISEAEALDMAIEALNQEPCEDAISKQTTINTIANTCFWLSGEDWNELMKCIESIPFVTPQPKTAHWVEHEIEGTLRWLECSNCHCETHNVKHNYCPNCGFEMVEPQERTDKE